MAVMPKMATMPQMAVMPKMATKPQMAVMPKMAVKPHMAIMPGRLQEPKKYIYILLHWLKQYISLGIFHLIPYIRILLDLNCSWYQ
jgi:hypothetical protein